MAGVRHATKKRFAKASTRQKTINQNISAEYIESRRKLDAVAASVKALIKRIESAGQEWTAIASQQTAFAETLVAALPTEGPVRSHAREVESAIRQLQRDMLADVGETSRHGRIMDVLNGYLKLVDAVQLEYPKVELTYTEVVRYQRKVDKLSKKAGKKREQLDRNLVKKRNAQEEHDDAIKHILTRINTTYDKHEAIFQCAHHAFWLAQERYATAVNNATRAIRQESMAVRDHLSNIDISNTRAILPLPRAQPLLPPPVVPPVAPQVFEQPYVPSHAPMQPQKVYQPVQRVAPPPQPMPPPMQYAMPANTSTGSLPNYAAVSSGQHPVVHLTPDSPTVSVTLPASSDSKGDMHTTAAPQNPASPHETLYFPVVPTDVPQMPSISAVTIEPTVSAPYVVAL